MLLLQKKSTKCGEYAEATSDRLLIKNSGREKVKHKIEITI